MGRSPCCEKAHTNKGAWSPEEDQLLLDYIRLHGQGCWRSLPKAAGLLRCGKSCRLRWMNYLRPDLKRGNFTEEEDELIIKLHSLLGNKWSLIAGRLSGRTDNEVKNYWNTHIRRKLLSRGLDPQTHRPLAAGSSELKISTLATDPAPAIPVLETSSVSRVIDFGKDAGFSMGSGDSSSLEGGLCSSGTTATTDDGAHLRKGEEIDLELSIGLFRFRRTQKASSASSTASNASDLESSPAQELRFLPVSSAPAVEGVCVCCQLGFQSGQMCRDCHTAKVAL